MDMNFLQTENIALVVPLVVALTQLVKMMNIPTQYSPFVSLIFGVVLAVLFNDDTFTQNWGEIVLQGVVYGLSASGLYSGVKTTAHSVKGEEE